MKGPQLLTPEQAASRLQVARTTVLDMLRVGHLVGVKVGPQWRIEPAALEAYIDEHRRPSVSAPTGVTVTVAPSPVLVAPSLLQQLMPSTRRFT